MMQGDSYAISIYITTESGRTIEESEVRDVEIKIGTLRKTYRAGEVRYEDGVWLFPISQDESFRLPAAHLRTQVRILWENGEVEGTILDDICLQESTSKEVL